MVNGFQRLFIISVDNPRHIYDFKSEKSVREEQERQLRSRYWVIHPYSKFRAWYEVYLIYLYASALVTKPIDAAFFKVRFYNEMPFYLYYTIIIDFLWWVHIVLNFFTGVVVEKPSGADIELDRATIAKKYIFGPHFFCDIISSIPKGLLPCPTRFDYVPIEICGWVSLFCLFKFIRLFSLISVIYKSAQYVRFEHRGTLFLFCSLIVTSVLIHWTACLQFAVPRLGRMYFSTVENYNSWIFNSEIREASLGTQYIKSFFKSSAYILGIHLDVFKEILPEDFILAVITYLFGKILVSCIWIILAVAILSARSVDVTFLEKINQLEEYLKQRELPLNLRERIYKYYSYKFQNKYFPEQFINGALSSNLRREVDMQDCKTLIANVSLFSDLSIKELSELVEYLTTEIFLPNDTILRSGTYGDGMYFLSSGTVALYTPSGKEICHLQDGAYFGEISLLLKGQKETATVRAIETSQIYRLSRRDFNKCLLRNQAVLTKIINKAKVRLQQSIEVEESFQKMLFEETFQGVSPRFQK